MSAVFRLLHKTGKYVQAKARVIHWDKHHVHNRVAYSWCSSTLYIHIFQSHGVLIAHTCLVLFFFIASRIGFHLTTCTPGTQGDCGPLNKPSSWKSPTSSKRYYRLGPLGPVPPSRWTYWHFVRGRRRGYTRTVLRCSTEPGIHTLCKMHVLFALSGNRTLLRHLPYVQNNN